MNSYIVIGLGRFGSALAIDLCKQGAEVLAMDRRSELVQQVANEVTHAVVGDAQDKEVLRALGVKDFDCAIVAIGDGLAASVLTVMNLQELGVPYIVAKAHDVTHRRVLEKLGVDRIMIPGQEQASGLPGVCMHTMCWNILSFPVTTAFWKFPHRKNGWARR